ncbi:hypothetical protein MHU86_22736 [Fragilaria crotonensis]|nr:hypothetical protein MHU86_22919 [Fragilaria crotonensis]KAI2491830.1 hypothetical protein MHU86_22736 [Fragilaria crotonensis]
MSSNNNNDDDSYLSKIQKAMAESDVSLRSAIKSGVEATNKTLASLEQSTEQIRKPVSNAVQIIGKEGQNVAQHATHMYQTRRENAPAWIGGSAVVGGLMGLRRGRVPAAITASVTGFLTYLVVYEVDLSKLPEHVFGKK